MHEHAYPIRQNNTERRTAEHLYETLVYKLGYKPYKTCTNTTPPFLPVRPGCPLAESDAFLGHPGDLSREDMPEFQVYKRSTTVSFAKEHFEPTETDAELISAPASLSRLIICLSALLVYSSLDPI